MRYRSPACYEYKKNLSAPVCLWCFSCVCVFSGEEICEQACISRYRPVCADAVFPPNALLSQGVLVS